jgi:protein-S-isoprenylcysteine O-methyltransferase Ste14
MLGGILLFAPLPVLGQRFLPVDSWPVWLAVGLALNLVGLLFTVWARLHLGKNWSDIVTLKQDHELITSGPYSIVRHPIYTGLLLAFAGLAVARGEWRSILGVVIMALSLWRCHYGVVIMALSLWRKLRIEERWMLEQFGSAYETYRQRVTALVPFVI